ncbi:MAG TPA: hypothetical protein VFS40_12320 [Gemmatimonadales bacterium]|nr:hypothetical protein [Gemmatimonadales bacterium]
MIPASPRVFALLGDPVAHSLSPAMHNAAFAVLGLPAVYVALRCRADDVPALAAALARAGGGGNVTVPHKGVAAAALACPTARVVRLEAANTFWAAQDGALAGDNTDVDGVLAALDALDAPATAWMVVGTGGAARAVAAAAAERGARLAVCSRDPGRAGAFAAWAATLGVAGAEADECDVVVNATPLGLGPGDRMPISRARVPRAQVALDLVYARGETPWVRALRAQGLRAADGREMLVAQGATAFERWFPGHRAPRDVMRGAVEAALRAPGRRAAASGGGG